MLLDDTMETFMIWNSAIVNDTYGGVTTQWTAGATFQGSLVRSTSTQAKIAEQLGVTDVFTLITGKDIVLPYHTVFQRITGDNRKTFRTTESSAEQGTPKSAGLQVYQVSVEEWAIPSTDLRG